VFCGVGDERESKEKRDGNERKRTEFFWERDEC
jgi:hypothetical protein